MQPPFGDAEGQGKRKQTRREIFSVEMEQLVPLKALLIQIEPHYLRSGRVVRPSYAMPCIHMLQQWYPVSDSVMKEALHEIASSRLPTAEWHRRSSDPDAE